MGRDEYLPLKSYGSRDQEPDSQPNDRREKITEKSISWNSKMYGFIFICFTNVGYGIATVLSQVSGLKSNIYQICTIRYLMIFTVAYCIIVVKQHSVKVEAHHLRMLLLCAFLHVIFDAALFEMASFVALGVLDGLKATFMVTTAVIYDFYMGSITKYCIVSAGLSFIGILFLTQPWNKTEVFSVQNKMAPCDSFGQGANNVSQNSSYHKLEVSKSRTIFTEIVCYALLVANAGLITLRALMLKSVMKHYPVSTVLFLSNVVECIFCLIINVVYANIALVPYFDMPTATYCFVSTFSLIVFAAFGNFSHYYSLKYAFVSVVAFGDVSRSVSLYVCQRTILKAFYPGHANALEIVGVFVVVVAVLIIPLSTLKVSQRESNKQSQ